MENSRQIAAEKKHRAKLRQQVGFGRIAMVVMVAISLLNQLLLLLNVNYHLHFSAAVPYYLHWLARQLSAQMNVTLFKVFAALLTILIFVVYVACWLLSAQRSEWLLAALGLYSVDTLLLVIFSFTLLENPVSCLLEILTHCVGIWLLWNAVRGAQGLRRAPRRRRVPVNRDI